MIQQIVPINFTLLGDGSSKVFKHRISQLFSLGMTDGSVLNNTETQPSSVSVRTVLDGSVAVQGGSLEITFNSAPANGHLVRVDLLLHFNGQ
jgi:hypothetical protein